jgi:hypothetical protein
MTETELFEKLKEWAEEHYLEDVQAWLEVEELNEMVDLIDFFETHLIVSDFYQALCDVGGLNLVQPS